MTESFPHDPIYRKYAEIDLAGRRSFDANEITGAEWNQELMKNRFHTALIFDEKSVALAHEKITQLLEKLESDLGIKLSIAGRDFPFHSTLESGDISSDKENEKDTLFERLRHNKTIKDWNDKLQGQVIDYRFVIMNKKGQAILVSADIPTEVDDYRKEMENVFQQAGLKPVLVNILHITLTRGEEFNLETDSENSKKIKDFLIQLRHSISREPFFLKVKEIYAGPCL